MGKFAIYSDLHFHPWEYGSYITNKGYNSRLYLQQMFLMHMGAYCANNNIRDLFFCGDFFHTHGKVSTDALFLACEAIRYISARGVSQHFNVGNHDISRKRVAFPLEPNSLAPFAMHGSIASSPVIGRKITSPNMVISMLPFIDNKDLLIAKLHEVSQVKLTGPHFLFLHQGVSNVSLGSGFLINEFLTPDMIPDNVTRAFTGHYHIHRDLGKLVIVGPPMQHTWADKEENGGFLVVDSVTGAFERVQLDNVVKNPKFVEMEAGFITLLSKLSDTNEDIEKMVKGNFVRINNITTDVKTAETSKMILLSMGALLVELNFKDRINNLSVSGVDNALSIEEIVNEYEKTLTPESQKIGQALRRGEYEIHKAYST